MGCRSPCSSSPSSLGCSEDREWARGSSGARGSERSEVSYRRIILSVADSQGGSNKGVQYLVQFPSHGMAWHGMVWIRVRCEGRIDDWHLLRNHRYRHTSGGGSAAAGVHYAAF
jgi:hypothetical protein